MKVHYLNDEPIETIVKIQDRKFDSTLLRSNSGAFYTLNPSESRVFDLDVPEGSVLSVKKWPGMVVLSFVEPAALSDLEGQSR